MADQAKRSGIFAGDDPFALTARWLSEAEKLEPSDANAMALATVDTDGLPNVRMVLLKDIEADAFVFYTNFGSKKSDEIARSGTAAFVLHWKSLRRQIRVRGLTEREEGRKADEYYHTRSLKSRLGAWASRQSQPLSSRAALVAEVARATLKHGVNPGRPPFWGGFRIRPLEIEFWADGPHRLHDRFRWRRDGIERPWRIERLSP